MSSCKLYYFLHKREFTIKFYRYIVTIYIDFRPLINIAATVILDCKIYNGSLHGML